MIALTRGKVRGIDCCFFRVGETDCVRVDLDVAQTAQEAGSDIDVPGVMHLKFPIEGVTAIDMHRGVWRIAKQDGVVREGFTTGLALSAFECRVSSEADNILSVGWSKRGETAPILLSDKPFFVVGHVTYQDDHHAWNLWFVEGEFGDLNELARALKPRGGEVL